MIRAPVDSLAMTDVRGRLPDVALPALVLHRSADFVPIAEAGLWPAASEQPGWSSDIPAALGAFTQRRSARVDWVREQSQALANMVQLPAASRDRALRERGTTAFCDRYQPLAATP